MSRTSELTPLAQKAVCASYAAGIGTQQDLAGVFHVSRDTIQRTLSRAVASRTTTKKELKSDG